MENNEKETFHYRFTFLEDIWDLNYRDTFTKKV